MGRDHRRPEAEEIGMITESNEPTDERQRGNHAYEQRVNHGGDESRPDPSGFERKTLDHAFPLTI